MDVVYTGETPPEGWRSAIFLAGPSPRKLGDPNWRTEAIELLGELGYEGVVFAPTYRDAPPENFDYDKQVEWERKWLNASDQIVFWVPRDLKVLPGFTTNVEYGMWLRSGKILLGSPEGAPKMDYLNWWADVEGIQTFSDLSEILAQAIREVTPGAYRTGGEREVPLTLWKKLDFQAWISAQKTVGNRLEGAEVVWNFRVGKDKRKTFLWALHVRVWITSEGREKTNEVVIFRPDLSTIVAYCRPPRDTEVDWLLDTEVVLIREFRSPANNEEAFVFEVPGGSSLKPGADALQTATDEFREETGLRLPADRLRFLGVRQVAATLSAHRAHLFAVELDPSELLTLKWGEGTPRGNRDESEVTYVKVQTVRELLREGLVDWSNVGMIFQALSIGNR